MIPYGLLKNNLQRVKRAMSLFLIQGHKSRGLVMWSILCHLPLSIVKDF